LNVRRNGTDGAARVKAICLDVALAPGDPAVDVVESVLGHIKRTRCNPRLFPAFSRQFQSDFKVSRPKDHYIVDAFPGLCPPDNLERRSAKRTEILEEGVSKTRLFGFDGLTNAVTLTVSDGVCHLSIKPDAAIARN
jgi:hypothetical protein